MAEYDLEALKRRLRGWVKTSSRGWLRLKRDDIYAMLAALEAAERDREYLREKNAIIKAYAGPTAMTPEDVAAALGRIPELLQQLAEEHDAHLTTLDQLRQEGLRAERVEAAARALSDRIERTLEGRRYCQWCGSDQNERDARPLGHFQGCEADGLRAALPDAPEGGEPTRPMTPSHRAALEAALDEDWSGYPVAQPAPEGSDG